MGVVGGDAPPITRDSAERSAAESAAAVDDDGAAPLLAPRWAGIVGPLVALAGVGVAGYLTYAHYTTATVLACPENGLINCAKVTTSSYSVIAGVPVALLGLLFFAVMAVLQLPVMWRSRLRGLRPARVAAALGGVVLVIWLVYAELFRLDAICLYCTAVHVLTVALFVVTVLGTAWTPAFDVADLDDLAAPDE